MKYSAIIFDLDGVICHTDQYHYRAWKEIADELDIYFDEQINNRLRGVSRMESFEMILEKATQQFTNTQKAYYISKKNDIYKSLLTKMSPQEVAPEVKETLEALKEHHLKLAIGSSSKNARFILERIGLIHFFDVIVDGNDITRSKPNQEVFLKAVGQLSKKVQECLVVEDALAGVEAAKNGNIDCAGIGDAAQSSHVKYRLSTFKDILKIIT